MYEKVLTAIVLALLMLVPNVSVGGQDPRYEITWEFEASANITTWIDKDHPAYAVLDISEDLFDVSPPYDPYGLLDTRSREAVDRCPQWLNDTLTLRLLDMDAATRSGYASILVDPSIDPSWLDEIAYSISDLPIEVLSDTRLDKRLFVENVQAMQRIDRDLEYVRIVDTFGSDGWHSTTEYTMPTGNCTLPEAVYYDYLVSPRNAMEVPAYINVTTMAYTTKEKGEFWRNYLYDETDDPGYPVLSKYLQGERFLWNGTKDQLIENGAMGAVCRWERECLPQWNVPSVRTHQPIVDYWNHMGFCGENSDFLAAAAKVALIPCVQIINWHIPHAWNEFYERGWHAVRAYDGMIDNPLSEGGPGIPAFGMMDPDGTEKDATPLYTTTVNLTITVSDRQGNPVDGALVNLENQPEYFIPEYGITSNNTDASGTVGFRVGVGNNIFAHVYSTAGQWPNATSTLGIVAPMTTPGIEYTVNMTVPKRVFTRMEDPLYDMDAVYGYRYSLTAREVRQYTHLYDDPLMAQLNILKEKDGPGKLRIAFLDQDNLDLYLSGKDFTPGRLVNLTGGETITLVLPIDRTWHPVFIGELQPLTVSFANLSISVETSDVDPDIEIVRPLPTTFLSTQTIHFEGRILPGISDPRYSVRWSHGTTVLSTELTFDTTLPPGHYDIVLMLLKDGVLDGEDSVGIDVVPPNVPPVAVISAPSDGSALEFGTQVQFRSDGSTDPDGASLEYLWMEGEEPLSLSASFATYFGLGFHTVTLNVTDEDGAHDQTTVRFSIVPKNHSPVAMITEPAEGSVFYEDERIELSANGSVDLDTEDLTFIWNSSIDGEICTSMNAYVLLSPGEHTIGLAVGDGVLWGLASVNITVLRREPPVDLPPVAMISSPKDGDHFNLSDDIVFDSAGSLDPEGAGLSRTWLIDGVYVSSDIAFEMRLDAGLHTIQLSVSDGIALDEAVIRIRVIDRLPTLVLYINGTLYTGGMVTVPENETITFDLTLSSDPDRTPLTYRWTVDDRNVSSSPVLDLRLGRGVHRVYFVIKDGTGLTAADQVLVESLANGTAPDNGTGDRGGGGIDPVLVVPIAIILLTAVMTVVFLVLRRRSRTVEE